MSLSDGDLRHLLHGSESDRVERKESLVGSAPDTIRQAICAFANDLPDHRAAGVIFVGARDDGSSSGFPISDAVLTQLASCKSDGNIVPPPTMTVEKRTIDGAEAARFLARLRERAATGSSVAAVLHVPTREELVELLAATRDHGHRLGVVLVEDPEDPRVDAIRAALVRSGWEVVLLPPGTRLRDAWRPRAARPIATVRSS